MNPPFPGAAPRRGAACALLVAALFFPSAARGEYPWDEMGKVREERETARRESVLQRAREFEEAARGQEVLERERLFAEFYLFHESARDRYIHDNNLDTRHWARMAMEREREMAPIQAEVAPVGWTFRTVAREGGWRLKDDIGWMEGRFGELLTLSWRDYLRGALDQEAPAPDHEVLERRVAFWEAFSARNPRFPLMARVKGFLEEERERLKESRRPEPP